MPAGTLKKKEVGWRQIVKELPLRAETGWRMERFEGFMYGVVDQAKKLDELLKEKPNSVLVAPESSGRPTAYALREALRRLGRKPPKTFYVNVSRKNRRVVENPSLDKHLTENPKTRIIFVDSCWALGTTEDAVRSKYLVSKAFTMSADVFKGGEEERKNPAPDFKSLVVTGDSINDIKQRIDYLRKNPKEVRREIALTRKTYAGFREAVRLYLNEKIGAR